MDKPTSPSAPEEIDIQKYPTAQILVSTICDLLSEIKDLTPGPALETHLNSTYPPTSPLYTTLSHLAKTALTEPWFASAQIDGPRYRRSLICSPSPSTRYLSITAVYIDSRAEGEGKDEGEGDGGKEKVYRGQYHKHPYGEINCVIPLTPGAELRGMHGWRGEGWTSPGAGSHHYPEVRGGAVIALFFLPAGRISYDARPGEPQPGGV